ncbi:MAG: hypothetical protein ACI959_000492 [Limisphaerales bacterium]|jgi:hypothetical protein
MRVLIIIICALSLIHATVSAQLIADAGLDTIYCGGDSIIIGGSPTASGGTAPYTYIWTTKIPWVLGIQHASEALDDSTKSNPQLLSVASESVEWFHLNVIDALGEVAIDSVQLAISRANYATGWCYFQVAAGDSSMLWLGGGSNFFTDAMNLIWTPATGLSDPFSANPIAVVDTTKIYNVTYEDDAGCRFEWSCEVEVLTTLVEQTEFLSSAKIWPNPSTGNVMIEVPPNCSSGTIEVLNSNGIVLKHLNIEADKISLNMQSSGRYYVSIQCGDASAYRKLIVVKDR